MLNIAGLATAYVSRICTASNASIFTDAGFVKFYLRAIATKQWIEFALRTQNQSLRWRLPLALQVGFLMNMAQS
jgi:hypothetical protein